MTVHTDVIAKLEEVLEIVKELPAGYQYKVRELCACIETVVGMHDDIQRGIIPEIFKKQEESSVPNDIEAPTVGVVPAPEESSKSVAVQLNLSNFEL